MAAFVGINTYAVLGGFVTAGNILRNSMAVIAEDH